MKIIVDAMGGDFAPKAQVEGALLALNEFGIHSILVGKEDDIQACFAELGHKSPPAGIEVYHASEVITMEDDPADIIRKKKDSSLVVGLNLLKNGGGDAIVSAGNTGALLSGATLITKRIKGIRRAALSPIIPNKEGGALLLDCGANVDCTPEYLLQFAFMGIFYVANALGRENPRVGLLNNGTEDTKGTALQLETFALLKDAHEAGRINFIGNVEARSLLLGGVDVVVADGFSGNILLKGIEGTAMFLMGEIKQVFMAGTKSKLAALLIKSGLRGVKAKLDVSEIGGTALLGITKPVIKAHGNSDAKTFRAAIRQAKLFAQANITCEIENNMEHITLKKEINP